MNKIDVAALMRGEKQLRTLEHSIDGLGVFLLHELSASESNMVATQAESDQESESRRITGWVVRLLNGTGHQPTGEEIDGLLSALSIDVIGELFRVGLRFNEAHPEALADAEKN